MPIPSGTIFRFKQTSPTTRSRLAIYHGKVIEVQPYQKKNGKWVKGHAKKINTKSN